MRSNNIERLEAIAKGLGDLVAHVFFVGGSVVELYVHDSGATPVRPTEDVDFVLEITPNRDIRDWERLLVNRGFRHDMSQGAPICRWLLGEHRVDIMSADPRDLGFSNRWYASAMNYPIKIPIEGGISIQLFALPYYIATKTEAVLSRGWPDLRTSHDFEDIVYLWDSVPGLFEQLRDCDPELRLYIAKTMSTFVKNPTFREAVEGHLALGSYRRASKVAEEMRALSVVPEKE